MQLPELATRWSQILWYVQGLLLSVIYDIHRDGTRKWSPQMQRDNCIGKHTGLTVWKKNNAYGLEQDDGCTLLLLTFCNLEKELYYEI